MSQSDRLYRIEAIVGYEHAEPVYRTGHIDRSGRVIVKPVFAGGRDFSEGLAQVYGEGYSVGFINTKGELVIKITGPMHTSDHDRHNGVSTFANGRALLVLHTNECLRLGYLEPWPRPGMRPEPNRGRAESWPLACYYIDTSGAMVFGRRFVDARHFSEGLAAVAVRTGRGDYGYGYIDVTGKFVIEPRFGPKRLSARDFSDGLAAVRLGRKWGFVDKSGKMVVPAAYDEVGDFREGRAAVATGTKSERRWGYIDKSGHPVIVPKFLQAQAFSGGLAAVCVNVPGKWTQWRYIDKDGNFAMEGKFAEAATFSEGLAAVRIGPDARFCYIDGTGRVVIRGPAVRAVRCEPFSGALARINYGPIHEPTGSGYVNKAGQYVWTSPRFASVTRAFIGKVERALGEYKLCIGHYPTEEEGGLRALCSRPPSLPKRLAQNWPGALLKPLELVDCWGNALNYEPAKPGARGTRTLHLKLWSNGPNGRDDRGGEDDIRNADWKRAVPVITKPKVAPTREGTAKPKPPPLRREETPKPKPPRREDLARIALAKAKMYLRGGLESRGREFLRQVIEKFPESEEAKEAKRLLVRGNRAK